MPDAPHFYVVRQRATDRAEHQRFASWIKRTGQWGEYRGQRYRYVTVDGWRYWTLGNIINRAAVTPDQSQPS
jgi:hypothetical protein